MQNRSIGILVGEQLGPITSGTTRAWTGSLGRSVSTTTVVFNKMTNAALAIFWQDDRIDRVMVCYQRQRGPCK